MNIHLAGVEGHSVVLHALRYPYRLCSYFYLSGDFARELDLVLETADDGSEWIMDSGLFSFMFGAHKGVLTTFDEYKRYADTYVERMHKWNWKHAIVECDAQRVLGVDETHRLRDEVFRPSGLEVIYVWHIPEGEDGLIELARREKRIALSVPELRMVLGSSAKVKSALIHCLRLIRNSGGNPRVHLLGNTEGSLLGLPADTSDSTSWKSGARWGGGITYDAKGRKLGKASLYSPKWKAWVAWCSNAFAPSFALMREHFKTNPKRLTYYENLASSAISYWLFMETSNGRNIPTPQPTELRIRAAKPCQG